MYNVKVVSKTGTCNNEIFEKMAENGDINAVKVSELIGANVTITGTGKCNITTDDKNFDIIYYDTKEYGLISSGSEFFAKSVETYINDIQTFIIKEIKTKKGKTYKAQPQLSTNQPQPNNEKPNELPF